MRQTYGVTVSAYCQVLTTAPSRDAADALAQSAVMARVAACAQVSGPVDSTYWWEGEPQTAQEWYVVFKTAADRYPALEAHILDNHEYDLPEVLALPVLAGNPAYLSWVTEETRNAETRE
jgi:periplasmic divalent cation tolerance protein